MSLPKMHLSVIATLVLLAWLTPATVHAQSAKELQTFKTFLSIMDGYLGIIEATHAINSDAEKAAVMQLQKIKESYEDMGDSTSAIAFYEGVLARAKNTTVRNTAYMLLGDVLEDQGRNADAAALFEKALNENLANLDNN